MATSETTRRRFEAEKAAYWAMREELLKQHYGKWVAIVGGQVVAVGDHKSEVLPQAIAQTQSKVGYINRVGYEDKVLRKRVSQAATGRYDPDYDPPTPMVKATVADVDFTSAQDVDFIVDSGSDITILRAEVADVLNLWDAAWDEVDVSGIEAEPERRQLYLAVMHLAEHDLPVEVDCRPDFDEDMLGRDVINEFELTLCAKRGDVRFRWEP